MKMSGARSSPPAKPRGPGRPARSPAILAAYLFALSGCTMPCCLPAAPAPASTEAGRWHQDLQYLATALPQCHIAPFEKVSESTFRQEVDALDARIDGLDRDQIIAGMARLVALLGDGHTGIYLKQADAQFKQFPVRFYQFDQDLYVVDTIAQHATARGQKVQTISTTDVPSTLQKVNELISHENTYHLMDMAPSYIALGNVLHGVDITSDPSAARFDLLDTGGTVTPFDFSVVEDPSTLTWLSASDSTVPLYRQQNDRYYWFTFLDAKQTLYFQYNVCAQASDLSMSDFAKSLFADLDSRNRAAVKMVIDLRNNDGGNSGVINPIIDGIKARPWIQQPGKLFVIIGRHTYSAALIAAIDLRDQVHAVLVGEPTGGKPNHLGNVAHFDLPNSKLLVGYSTKRFVYETGVVRDALYPHLQVLTTPAQYFAGSDPVMDAIDTYLP